MSQEPSFSIAAIFDSRASAEAAIADLETTGLGSESVQLLAHGSEPDSRIPVVPVAATYIGGIESLNFPGFAPGLGAALVGLMANDKDIELLHTRLERGEAMVAVEAGDRKSIVRTVLERNGGEIVGS